MLTNKKLKTILENSFSKVTLLFIVPILFYWIVNNIKILTYFVYFIILLSILSFLINIYVTKYSNTKISKFVSRYIYAPISFINGIFYVLLILLVGFYTPYLSVGLVWLVLYAGMRVFILLVNLNIHIDIQILQPVLIYVSTLITILLMTYNGEKIINFIYEILNSGTINKNKYSIVIAREFFNYLNIRKILYEISILFYIYSVIETFIGYSIIDIELWTSYKMISLEILLTFVAIDSYVDIFIKENE